MRAFARGRLCHAAYHDDAMECGRDVRTPYSQATRFLPGPGTLTLVII